MKKLILIAAALVAIVGCALTAWAACPDGTTYKCEKQSNGKESCGCR